MDSNCTSLVASDSLYSQKLLPSGVSPPQRYDHFELQHTEGSAISKEASTLDILHRYNTVGNRFIIITCQVNTPVQRARMGGGVLQAWDRERGTV